MEHIVQFAVGVDDTRIQQIMEESAAKQIMNDIKEFSHGKQYYGDRFNDEPKNLREIFEEKIMEYIRENADTIMDKVVNEVANRVIRTKKFRETVDRVAQ